MKILDSQMETGTPYLLYKDACNLKSNQQNIGTIKSSNLCTEIIEYSDENETAVCNLASIALSMYINSDNTFNFEKLYSNTKILVTNLNNIIDINFYPTIKTERSNLYHRPIGIGVQGLADTFFKMKYSFTSTEAKELNKMIFETIYYAALERSNEIAKERCENMLYLQKEYNNGNWHFIEDDNDNKFKKYYVKDDKIEKLLNKYNPIKCEILNLNNNLLGSYSSFIGSPISNGKFQFDLWNSEPIPNRYDWDKLRASIKEYGIRNSLLTAPMPTASTSQILGNNECFEPITSNIYSRSTLAGQFILVNKYLVNELLELKLWDESIKNNIIENKGSIQHIQNIPQDLKDRYKTVWEIPMKDIIDMSRDRGIYICQSQSLNLWMEDPEPKALTNMHFYSWKIGLKTGIYYLRRKAKHQAQQFTIEPKKDDKVEEDCLMCGS